MKNLLVSVIFCGLASVRVLGYDVNLSRGWNLIANQLNRTGGNSISNLFPDPFPVPDGTDFYIYRKGSCSGPEAYFYCYHCDIGGTWSWYTRDLNPIDPTYVTLDPGDALFINVLSPLTLTFTGSPNVPSLPLPLSCGCGHYYYLSRQTNGPGSFENITGWSPQEGSQFQRWTGSNYSVYTFSAGSWTPSVPLANVGEAVRILPSPCFSNGCLTLHVPTNIVVSSCTNLPVFYAPTATDLCTNAIDFVCTPKSGSLFSPGTTTPVHCLAVDAAGNGAVGDFTVTVLWPKLEVTRAGDVVTLTWTGGGILQEADTPAGAWTDAPNGQVSPHPIPSSSSPLKFYRLGFE